MAKSVHASTVVSDVYNRILYVNVFWVIAVDTSSTLRSVQASTAANVLLYNSLSRVDVGGSCMVAATCVVQTNWYS